MTKHCKKCGWLLVDSESPFYDEETGEKLIEKACSQNACHTFGHEYVRSGVFGLLRCRKCKKRHD